jgi:hypothetical protein
MLEHDLAFLSIAWPTCRQDRAVRAIEGKEKLLAVENIFRVDCQLVSFGSAANSKCNHDCEGVAEWIPQSLKIPTHDRS